MILVKIYRSTIIQIYHLQLLEDSPIYSYQHLYLHYPYHFQKFAALYNQEHLHLHSSIPLLYN